MSRKALFPITVVLTLAACGADGASEQSATPTPITAPTEVTFESDDPSVPGDGYAESIETFEEILSVADRDPDFYCRPSSVETMERAMDVTQGPTTQINILAEYLASGAVSEDDPATMLVTSWPDDAQRAYFLIVEDAGSSDDSACMALQ